MMIGTRETVDGYVVQRVLRDDDGRSVLTEAADPRGRSVALEVRTAPLANLEGRVERIAALAAASDAPLVPVLGAGAHGGRAYVVHPMTRGRALADRLREGRLEPTEAVAVLSAVAGALETLSAFGLPHGPLTPSRIRLTGRGSTPALLCDAGLGPRDGAACATPAGVADADYLAPEVLRGRPAGPAAAVYALGCILVECLTGAPPFLYDRPLLVLQAHLSEAPPKVSERAAVPEALDDVVTTALHKRPEQRQRSPAGLMRAVQRALGVRMPIPVAHPPALSPPPASRAPRPASTGRSRRAPWPVPAAGAVAAPPASAAPRPASTGRRRRRSWPAPAAGALAATLVISAGGFAAGKIITGADGGSASAQRAAPAGHAAYVRDLDRVVSVLSTRRAEARRRLGAARSARAQATAAGALGDLYTQVRRALPSAPAGDANAGTLPAQLLATETAYRALSAAAAARDARAYRLAARTVMRREQSLVEALGRI